MLSALTATAIFASMAMVTKKVNDETGVHTLVLLEMLGQLSMVMFLPVWMYFDFSQVIAHPIWTAENTNISIVFLLVMDGICHWLQNILAFTMMNKLSKLSYAVANATKRIVIISTSLLVLMNHVTAANIVGMAMAILGVFLYNKVKLDEKLANERLPVTAMHPEKTVELWNNNHFNSKVQLTSPAAAYFTYPNGNGYRQFS